jgi:alanine racemase
MFSRRIAGTSRIEVSRSALANNFNFLKERIGSGIVLASVVKSNAYGHGLELFVPIAEDNDINYFAVFCADEAYRVRLVKNEDSRIIIMGWMDRDDIIWAIEHGIEFYVFDIQRLETAVAIAKDLEKPALIHLELETGMNRTGIYAADMKRVYYILENSKGCLSLKGLCTHYAGAESVSNYLRIKNQIQHFKRMHKSLLKRNLQPEFVHTACSAAAMNYPQTRMDMVRIGIMQYGFWPNRETFIQYAHRSGSQADPLQRALRWISKIMTIKTVQTGCFVGYGTNYLAQEDSLIAVVPVGYYHGYSRSLSNQSYVLVRGYRANVIGLVNMNMMIVNVTQIPEVEIGDEVVLIGKQGELEISVASFSEMSSLMNYEMLTRLPENIERAVVK